MQPHRVSVQKTQTHSHAPGYLLVSQPSYSEGRRIFDLAIPGMFRFKFTKKVQDAYILFEHRMSILGPVLQAWNKVLKVNLASKV